MKQSTGKSWLLLVILLFAMSIAGCGTPPPCNVDTQQVEEARGQFNTAEAEAAAASEAMALQEKIDALQGKTLNAQELADLREQLEELKKGSGR